MISLFLVSCPQISKNKQVSEAVKRVGARKPNNLAKRVEHVGIAPPPPRGSQRPRQVQTKALSHFSSVRRQHDEIPVNLKLW